ncbi:MAG: hypothetical protein JWM21_2793 [Acidobacteria bacterium]|nr:hypothetical protein [Acidobacteriota bacterium]
MWGIPRKPPMELWNISSDNPSAFSVKANLSQQNVIGGPYADADNHRHVRCYEGSRSNRSISAIANRRTGVAGG